MIIDFHAHCFNDKLAHKAIVSIAANAGELPRYSDATVKGLKESMAKYGVDIAVVQNIATKPSSQHTVNDFAAEINGKDGIIAFGSVHPFAPDWEEELDRIVSLGLRGIKFHPHFQRFAIDDERAFPVYKKVAALGLITLFHVGCDLGFLDTPGASPRAMAKALQYFDGAPVVAAHLGGCACWHEAREWMAGTQAYLDTSCSCGHVPLPEAKRIIDKHGTDRLLFGTDIPWSDAGNEMAFLRTLGLSDVQMQDVLGNNAQKLLGI